MLVIYCIGNLIFVVFFLSTISYKKKQRKRLDKKAHKLWILYGLGMFLADRIPRCIIFSNKKINYAIRALSVKDNIEKEKYLYVVQKITMSVVILWGAIIIGTIISFSEYISQAQYIKNLKRDERNIEKYEFIAEDEKGQRETLSVEVDKRELTEDEIYELFEKEKNTLTKIVLGKNKSVECVNRSLNLVNSIGEKGIEISWDISDSNIVAYDGSIGENIASDGTIVNLTATMMLNDISLDYTFSVNVFPQKENMNLQSKIQKFVDENDKQNHEVKLPEMIDGKQMKYYEQNSMISYKIWGIGIVLSIALFFLKDRDIKKELSKRTDQMLKDYPEIASKILLYYEAGLSIQSGFEKIVQDYQNKKKIKQDLFRYAYEEMEMALTKMKSGVSEIRAVNEYGNRCALHCYLKLSNIIEQNMKRGSKELVSALKNEVEHALLERKNNALREGEKISTKLLGPMVLLLIISISLIIVPAYMSINY